MRRIVARMTQWGATLVVLSQVSVFADDAVPLAVVEPIAEVVIADALPLNPAQTPPKVPLFQHATYPTAWTAAQKSNRPILVFVSMPNCPHCVKMVDQTYHLPHVEALVSSSFETIYAGRYTHAKLVEKLHIKWYPTTVLVGPNNKILDVIEGYVDPGRFQQRLQTGLASLNKPSATQTR